ATRILEASEGAAKAAGYRRLELGARLPGVPLYLSYGFRVARHIEVAPSPGGERFAPGREFPGSRRGVIVGEALPEQLAEGVVGCERRERGFEGAGELGDVGGGGGALERRGGGGGGRSAGGPPSAAAAAIAARARYGLASAPGRRHSNRQRSGRAERIA